MRCAECERLKAEAAELRAQLAAWEAYDAAPLDVARLARWTAGLKCTPQVATVLMLLADAKDSLVTRDRIIERTRAAPMAKADEPHKTLAPVLIWKARAVLERFALLGAIESHHGLGWVMPIRARHQVLAMVGEAA